MKKNTKLVISLLSVSVILPFYGLFGKSRKIHVSYFDNGLLSSHEERVIDYPIEVEPSTMKHTEYYSRQTIVPESDKTSNIIVAYSSLYNPNEPEEVSESASEEIPLPDAQNTVLPSSVLLNAENILQKPHLPNGCEVVSLAIALKYAGYYIDPVELYDNYMPKSTCTSGDPWNTYVGNAKGLGLGCYAPCVVETGNSYLSEIGTSKIVTDISGTGFSYYEKLLSEGTPVIFWGTVNMNANSAVYWERFTDGTKYVWHTYSHCLVMIGYTSDTYIFCDPLIGIAEYPKEAVKVSHEIMFSQACIIE